ncbi:10733_t:CDS:10, partial [Paraglomus occultum]
QIMFSSRGRRPVGRYPRRAPHHRHHHQANIPQHGEHRADIRDSTKLSRIQSLLSRIRDDNESVYTRRTNSLNQLSNMVNESMSTWEANQLFESMTKGTGGMPTIESLFEDTRSPSNARLLLSKFLAQVALNMKDDIELYLRWTFERLHVTASGNRDKDKERKMWIVASLRELLSRPAHSSSHPLSSILQPLIPSILIDVEALLDSMECVDCFPVILEVLEKIVEKYPNEFCERFQDIIDLLVGWHIDTSVSDNLHRLISETFLKLRPCWARNLEFAFELMSHFLTDMEIELGLPTLPDVGKEKQNESDHEENDKDKKNGISSNVKALLSCFHAVADAVGGVVPAQSTEHSYGAGIDDNSYPFDKLHAWIIKILNTIADTHLDVDWLRKGNQIIISLSAYRKAASMYQQMPAITFYLNQLVVTQEETLTGRQIDEWFDGLLQILSNWIPVVHPEILLTLAHPKSKLQQLRVYNPRNARLFADILEMFRILIRNQNNMIEMDEVGKKNLIRELDNEVNCMMELIIEDREGKRDKRRKSRKEENEKKVDGMVLVVGNDANKVPEKENGEVIADSENKDVSVNEMKKSNDKENSTAISKPTDETVNRTIASLVLVADLELLSEIAKSWNRELEVFSVLLRVFEKINKCAYFDAVLMTATIKSMRNVSRSCSYFLLHLHASNYPTFSTITSLITSIFINHVNFPINIISLTIDWFLNIIKHVNNEETRVKADLTDNITKNTQKYTRTDAKVHIDTVLDALMRLSEVSRDREIRLAVARVLRDYFKVFGSVSVKESIVVGIWHRIADVDPKVQTEYAKLLYSINPFYAAFQHNEYSDTLYEDIRSTIISTPHLGTFRPRHFQILMAHLGMEDFLSTTDSATLHDSYPPENTNNGEWLQRLFYSCQSEATFEPLNQKGRSNVSTSQNSIKNNPTNNNPNAPTANDTALTYSIFASTIANSIPLLTFWSLWESTRYCILSRLRTPFGGPKQTFDCLERHLNDLLDSIGNTLGNDGNEASKIETSEGITSAEIANNGGITSDANARSSAVGECGFFSPSSSPSTPTAHLANLRALLTLLTLLELQIHNATTGTALSIIPPAPRPSIVFFRTNEKVCGDWFSRVRYGLVKGARIVGDDAMVVRHGISYLKEKSWVLDKEKGGLENEREKGGMGDRGHFRQGDDFHNLTTAKNKQSLSLNYINEFQTVCMYIVESLERLKEGDIVVGLKEWCVKNIEEKNARKNGGNINIVVTGGNVDVTSTTPTVQPCTRTLLQRKPLPRSWPIPASLMFTWMNPSIRTSYLEYEASITEATQVLNELFEHENMQQEGREGRDNSGQAQDAVNSRSVIRLISQFVTSNIIDCYIKLDDMSSLSEWIKEHKIEDSMLRPLVKENRQYVDELERWYTADVFEKWEVGEETGRIGEDMGVIKESYEGPNDIRLIEWLYRLKYV